MSTRDISWGKARPECRTSPPPVSRLPTKCGILYVSYTPPRPVTGIALLSRILLRRVLSFGTQLMCTAVSSTAFMSSLVVTTRHDVNSCCHESICCQYYSSFLSKKRLYGCNFRQSSRDHVLLLNKTAITTRIPSHRTVNVFYRQEDFFLLFPHTTVYLLAYGDAYAAIRYISKCVLQKNNAHDS
jgi:hypothetical protein